MLERLSPHPLESGRALLGLGGVQLRLRQRAAARATLSQAQDTFERIRAPLWPRPSDGWPSWWPAGASGTEHFSLMSTQPNGSKYTIIATGLFTAGGVDVSGSKSDLVKLPGGTFKISHGQGHVIKQQVNPQTCLAVFVDSAKFTVGSGTGAYKGISGSGKALVSFTGIARKVKGKCDLNANPVVAEQTIKGSGRLTL